jgi:hypothetical protein
MLRGSEEAPPRSDVQILTCRFQLGITIYIDARNSNLSHSTLQAMSNVYLFATWPLQIFRA